MIPQLARPLVEALGEQAALVDHGVAGVTPPPVYPELGHGEVKVCARGEVACDTRARTINER